MEVGSAIQTDRCADVVHSRAAVVPALEAPVVELVLTMASFLTT